MDNTYKQVKEQTGVLRQQLVGTQGAVLDFGFSYLDSTGELRITAFNAVGRVNATHGHLRVNASQRRIANDSIIGTPFHFDADLPPIIGGRGWSPSPPWIVPWRLTEHERTQGSTWDPQWPGKRTFVFQGELTYDDGFRNEVSQSFCKKWVPGYAISYKQQTSGGGGGTALVDCGNFENFVRSVKQQEKEAEQGADHPH
jgi:hypothetical protein